jgi:hypothetical protein
MLNREMFTIITEDKMLIEQWSKDYNESRPHSILGYWPSAPEATIAPILT